MSRAEALEGSQTVTMEPVAELGLGSHVAISDLILAPGRLLVKSNLGQLLQVRCLISLVACLGAHEGKFLMHQPSFIAACLHPV